MIRPQFAPSTSSVQQKRDVTNNKQTYQMPIKISFIILSWLGRLVGRSFGCWTRSVLLVDLISPWFRQSIAAAGARLISIRLFRNCTFTVDGTLISSSLLTIIYLLYLLQAHVPLRVLPIALPRRYSSFESLFRVSVRKWLRSIKTRPDRSN